MGIPAEEKKKNEELPKNFYSLPPYFKYPLLHLHAMLSLPCCKCLAKSCVGVKKDTDAELFLCLLHYHLLDDAQQSVMRVLDENEWERQDAEVREKVTNAASDLVLQMMVTNQICQ